VRGLALAAANVVAFVNTGDGGGGTDVSYGGVD
jgi:hypothetical protein